MDAINQLSDHGSTMMDSKRMIFMGLLGEKSLENGNGYA